MSTYSLKDQLFNFDKITLLASEIAAVYPVFQQQEFIKNVMAEFPSLELKQRISWIRQQLQAHLPSDYRQAVGVILAALPPPLDPNKQDDDFGDFIYAPYSDFVAEYGCNAADLDFSLDALHQITQRFSAEAAIRPFLAQYPDQTFSTLARWATDPNYHVRRLVSEGTRPFLPWATRIPVAHLRSMPLLEKLHADSTRYVTRSVANHLNDISKIDPDLVIQTLKRWQQLGVHQQQELDFIVQHSLRTLIKKGNKNALKLLGFDNEHRLLLSDFKISELVVKVGESLEFSFAVSNPHDHSVPVVLDYTIFFQNKHGQATNKKIFKLTKTVIPAHQTLTFVKKHPLRIMTTRTLYSGRHAIQVHINGSDELVYDFELVAGVLF